MSTTTRQTAEVRREAVLEAAAAEFSRRGLHGASTDAIAKDAGISQPYLFRLFGTKKELYLATTSKAMEETYLVVERVSGEPPEVVSTFFAKGMLLNVMNAMQLFDDPTPWGDRLIAGCAPS